MGTTAFVMVAGLALLAHLLGSPPRRMARQAARGGEVAAPLRGVPVDRSRDGQ